MPVDPNQQAQTAVTLVERYGSFGLLVVIVFAGLLGIGWCVWYAATRLGPRAMAFLEKLHADHETAMERRDAVCKVAAETSARAVEQMKLATQSISELTTQVAQLRDRGKP